MPVHSLWLPVAGSESQLWCLVHQGLCHQSYCDSLATSPVPPRTQAPSHTQLLPPDTHSPPGHWSRCLLSSHALSLPVSHPPTDPTPLGDILTGQVLIKARWFSFHQNRKAERPQILTVLLHFNHPLSPLQILCKWASNLMVIHWNDLLKQRISTYKETHSGGLREQKCPLESSGVPHRDKLEPGKGEGGGKREMCFC